MRPWTERAPEEANLLNPAFLALLLHRTVAAYADEERPALPFILSTLVCPLVLHKRTREALPKKKTSSLLVWVNAEPSIRASLPQRVRALLPHTREAIIFAVQRGALVIQRDSLAGGPGAVASGTAIRRSSAEIDECIRKAELVGRWFAHAGTPEAILAVLGLEP